MAEEKGISGEAEVITGSQLDAFLRSPIPKIYFNGVGLAFGTADVTLILQLHNAPIAITSMSYPVAKTLAKNLTSAIQEAEKLFGVNFHSLETAQEGLKSKAK